jgi:hypothetical protein
MFHQQYTAAKEIASRAACNDIGREICDKDFYGKTGG